MPKRNDENKSPPFIVKTLLNAIRNHNGGSKSEPCLSQQVSIHSLMRADWLVKDHSELRRDDFSHRGGQDVAMVFAGGYCVQVLRYGAQAELLQALF